MQSRLDCPHIPAKLLVNALIGLRNDLVGVVHEAAANTRHPGSHAPATLAPAVHTLAVKGNLSVVHVRLRKDDVLGLTVETLSFVLHAVSLNIYIRHRIGRQMLQFIIFTSIHQMPNCSPEKREHHILSS